MLRVINMIPRTASGEARQDAEPNIAVNPANPRQIVASAFTRDPLNGPRAPVFVSNDGGLTWQLRLIVPGGPSTSDISLGYGDRGGELYAGILNFSDTNLNVLRTADPFTPTPMTLLVDRANEDQPWVTATTARTAGGADQDRVYIGHNDFNLDSQTASVELSQDARTAAAPAGFATHVVERGTTGGQDGPAVRIAVHPDGIIYAVFQRWTNVTTVVANDVFNVHADIVVVRDDGWAASADPFSALTDPGDPLHPNAGVRVATDRFIRFTMRSGPLGQDRIGGDLAIAVDPTNSASVWLAYCDRVGGANGTDWTIHVRHSRDSGQTWLDDIRTITDAKNPALAVNADGLLGFMFQQLVGTVPAARWVTQLELTADAWATPATSYVLHTALATDPPRIGLPYLGDYIRLLAVNTDFYGVFSGSNLPDTANFPNGIVYQRNADWTHSTLLSVDNATPVAVSIDPFFIHWSQGQLSHNDQQDPALGGAWTGWNFLSNQGDRAKDLVVVPNADGRLHAFMIGMDDQVWHNDQQDPALGGAWTGWNFLSNQGDRAKDLVVVPNADGRLHAFMIGMDDQVWHNDQQDPALGGAWTGWNFLSNQGDRAKDLVVVPNADGRLHAFMIGMDDQVLA